MKFLLKTKLIRISTVPVSLKYLLKGQMGYMRQNNFEVIMASAMGEEIKTVIQNEKCKHFTFPLTRKITPFKDLQALFLLYRFFKKVNPQIVHTHTPKAGTIGMLAAWLCRVPIRMHTVAGLPLMEATGVKRVLLNWVETITYSCATKVYPNSFGLKQIILQYPFCKPEKLKVIGNGSSNGIDTAFFSRSAITESEIQHTQNTWKLKPEDLVFVFIGRLVKDKGINELVSAFSRVNQSNPQTQLLLVGNYEEKLDPLQAETIETINNNSAIISTGFQSDVRPFLAVSHVLVFPSYREGFPNVPMQAGAMELPCIVTDINGCNEIIVHEKNGLIVPPKNEAALEAAMLELLVNKEKRKRQARNARQMIVERYEQQMVWKLIKEEYDEQLAKASIIS